MTTYSKLLLYQLSYLAKTGIAGFEPATSCLTGKRSNRWTICHQIAAGGIRTHDLWRMSPASCQLLYPAYFLNDAGRIRTCTSFLMDDLANRSANHYGTAPLQIQVVLNHHLTRNRFLCVLSIELSYLSRHSRDSNPGTLYGQPVFKTASSTFRTYGIVNCSIFPNS